MFREIASQIKSTYSTNDDVAQTFYNPILENSVSYQRVSGFFSTKALALYATGLDRLADAGGYVRFIISTQISRDDFMQIKTGYQLRDALGLKTDNLSDDQKKKVGNLAYLISTGKADVRFGVSESGLFHSKWGYFEDASSDIVYFIGSNNETGNGIVDNYEDFDVDVSWDPSLKVRSRIETKKKQFEQLWNDDVNNVQVIKADRILYQMLEEYDKGHIQSLPGRALDALVLEREGDTIRFVDHTHSQVLMKRSLQLRLDYYLDQYDHAALKAGLKYTEIDKLIALVSEYARQHQFRFYVGDELQDFLQQRRYSITQYQKAGMTLKAEDPYWNDRYLAFKSIVAQEVARPLKDEQMRAAFYFLTQKRAANFSVPGSGKTTTMLGVFAYLNRGDSPAIKRILVVSPLNAFTSWTDEFETEFKGHKSLHVVTSHDGAGSIIAKWSRANLVLVNYEALQSESISKALTDCLSKDGKQTMLIFDEVHRVKSISGKRATQARKLTDNVEYRYVMTGTPIPNGYIDIWQFLHLLYEDEYDSFFSFTQTQLKSPDAQTVDKINKDLAPFFWRTNKEKLGVPPAEPDQIKRVAASAEQLRLADTLYETESNPLAIMIRLMQLSTNPSLLSKALTTQDLADAGFDNGTDEDDPRTAIAEQLKSIEIQKVSDVQVDQAMSPKFQSGIDLVSEIVTAYGKVVVWALFVDTIDKICAALQQRGIRTEVVYGATPVEDRERLISRFKEDNEKIQVLVTNPNTLGESMSLHKVVHNAVYFEYNYNLTFMLQSRDRIHRLGLAPDQKTRYWYLMTVSNRKYHNFIDEQIYERLKKKEKQMLDAIDKGVLEPQYSDQELTEMEQIIDRERHI